MITQIEIDGFKTFKDFKVELAPFQVIVGSNGSGKSNLFDALQLLGRLAKDEIVEAFQHVRGKAREVFTRVSDQTSLRSMRFAVEMLLDRYERDDTGEEVKLEYTRLRYEIEIKRAVNTPKPDRLYISYETLKTIPREKDHWTKKYHVPSALFSTVSANEEIYFIETNTKTAESVITINRIGRRQDGSNEYRVGLQRSARNLPCTALSLVIGPEYLPITAVRSEMRSWAFLHLNPEELREPSSVQSSRLLTQYGGNLPTMLAHMQAEDEFVLTDISREMASLAADIYKVKVERNPARDEYEIWIEISDHRTFSSAVLSDGTLRLLALVAMKHDPQFRGVLCLEEPENSMHPLQLEQVARLLRRLATNFFDVQQEDEPLRQVLITAHSPAFASLPEVIDSLLLAFMPLQAGNGELTPLRVTRMVPVVSPQEAKESKTRQNRAAELYTLDTVRQFLNPKD